MARPAEKIVSTSTLHTAAENRIITSSYHRLRMPRSSSKPFQNTCNLPDPPLVTTPWTKPFAASNVDNTTTYNPSNPTTERLQQVPKAFSSAVSSKLPVSTTQFGPLMTKYGPVTGFEYVSPSQAMDPNVDLDSPLSLALECTLSPTVLRKKSGETLRPALRNTGSDGRRLSISDFSGSSRHVHFGSRLEDVRYFFRLDMPSSVSSDCSPTESESESDYDDGVATSNGSPSPNCGSTAPSPAWKLRLPNFPPLVSEQKAVPVRLERLTLSGDGSSLIGVVNVLNYAYHKIVAARFTFDSWTTVSEVTADYSHGLPPKRKASYGNDKFKFKIGLSDITNLEDRTLHLCVRYTVNGMEYWDNNNSRNYEAIFIKEEPSSPRVPQPIKARPLTRSRNAVKLSPHWPVLSIDDFSPAYDHQHPCHQKHNRKDTTEDERLPAHLSPILIPHRTCDNPSRNLSSRYDLGASLTAALLTKTSGVSGTFDEPGEQGASSAQPGLEGLTTSVANNIDYINPLPLLSH